MTVSQRRVESDLPKDALASIHVGTVGYKYRGVLCQKSPFDLALYARLLFEAEVRSVVEIGTAAGGSALWFADLLRTYGRSPHVLSMDRMAEPVVSDPDITFLRGDACSPGDVLTPERLAALPRPWLWVEDSAHTFDVSLAVLDFAHDKLAPGEYIVVEDGIVNDLPADQYRRRENGPNRAVLDFLDRHPEQYEIDLNFCDYFGHNFTWNPNGWLRRL